MAPVSHPSFPNLHEISHPLVATKLSRLRDKNTNTKAFRELVHEITLLLTYEATRSLATHNEIIDTPLESTSVPVLSGPNPVILPILRAGLGMVDAMLSLLPAANVGHIGISRNENTFEPDTYFLKLPDNIENSTVFVCDPMLATGGSAVSAVSLLKDRGVKQIIMVNILAAPEGVQTFFEHHPDVPVYVAVVDKHLDDRRYIRPGLGDAGDRMFGTR